MHMQIGFYLHLAVFWVVYNVPSLQITSRLDAFSLESSLIPHMLSQENDLTPGHFILAMQSHVSFSSMRTGGKKNNQVEGRRGMLRVKPPCECARREIGDGTVVFKVT